MDEKRKVRRKPMIEVGQGRAESTIRMKAAYDSYAIDAQTGGQTPLPYKEWVKKNHPDVKVL